MKDMKRALRRHHQVRRKHAAKKLEINRHWFLGLEGRALARAVGRAATDRVVCSCHMCGNPRRLKTVRQHGRTRQELKLFMREFD